MSSIAEYLTNIQSAFAQAVAFFILFGTLGRFMPCNPKQPVAEKGLLVDAFYYFIIPVFTRFVQLSYITLGVALLFHGESDMAIQHYIMHGFGPLGQLPLWAQAAIAFILSDCILYWTHRLFHGHALWRFHAVHHSPTVVDWHTTYRFHPANVWLTFTLVDTLMVFLGLSLNSILIMTTFNALYSGMVHANLNWTFGPFKYIFASPVFHRWHHTTQAEGLDKNFAPTFPLLDVVFGTFYMPDGKLPEHYGIEGNPVPESFIGQLAYPFSSRD